MGSTPSWAVAVGIDMAKGSFVTAVGNEESFELANESAGHDALRQRLQGREVGLIVLEATGGLRTAAGGGVADGWIQGGGRESTAGAGVRQGHGLFGQDRPH